MREALAERLAQAHMRGVLPRTPLRRHTERSGKRESPAGRLRADTAGRCLGSRPRVQSTRARPHFGRHRRGHAPGCARAAILPALLRPPCVMSFTGGRGSSLVLAVAVQLARREGLELPVPATIRMRGSANADESAYQERLVIRLGLTGGSDCRSRRSATSWASWRRLFFAATVSSGHPMRTSGRRYSTGRSVVRCSPASGTAGQVVKHPRSSSGTSGPCRGSGRLPSVRCGHSGWRTPCVGGGRSATWHGGYGFVRSVFGSTFCSEWARRDGSNSVIHFSTQKSWRLARRSQAL